MPSFCDPAAERAGGSRIGRIAVITAMLVAASGVGSGQTPAATQDQRSDAASTSSSFTIFLRTVPIGSETVTVDRTAAGWTIRSSGRADVPIDLIARNLVVRYSADWKPIDLTIDATIRGQAVSGSTTVAAGNARNIYTQAGQTRERTDPIAANAILLASPMWGPFEALARRLREAPQGSSIPGYSLGAAMPIEVGASSEETLQMGGRTMRARKSAITLLTAGSPLAVEVWGDESGRLMRISVPAQNLEVVRDDISSVAVRHVVVSRPGDVEIRIPANGFRLAGTVSKPPNASKTLPAIILVGGSDLTDRDENLYGIPIFGQLAGTLADAGFLVVRYDKRGVGQSGGRAEAATIEDFAEDLLAVVKAVRGLPGVDRKRIAVVGHGDGGTVALLGASRQSDIAGLVLVSSMGTTGAELNMWQVSHGLDHSNRTAAEKQATVDLQQRIQQAVVTGSGWEAIPAQYRRQADIPWFKSYLTFDPAKVLPKVNQPIFIVQGLLDTQVPPSNADRLEALAKRRKNGSVEVARLAGVNHLLVEATTGEVDEYVGLKDKQVSPAVGRAIADWLQKTFAVR
jgi:pimeloyl-ACP methyl ester carboxylesterase